MKNAGKAAHKVTKHVAVIQNIRDRTMHIASRLFSSTLLLTPNPTGTGLSLSIRTKSGKAFQTDWIPTLPPTGLDYDKFGLALLHIFSPQEIGQQDGGEREMGYSTYTDSPRVIGQEEEEEEEEVGSPNASKTIPVVFPCVAVTSRFDPFTIIHGPALFTLVGVDEFTSTPATLPHAFEEQKTPLPLADSSHSDSHYSACGVYEFALPLCCARDVWELNHTLGHSPGDALLGLSHHASSDRFTSPPPNMIIPLAHTPLLFSLYVERCRAYQSGVNVTGDCIALVQTSYQWGKVIHDVLVSLSEGPSSHRPQMIPSSSKQRLLWSELGLISIVSYSYAIESTALPPNADFIYEMFGLTATALSNPIDLTVISRDAAAGLTCPLAFAALIASPNESFTRNPNVWNLLVTTLFSRLCESIAGVKNIRYRLGNDPSELEEGYRLLLGQLQTTLQRRLHIEWVSSTWDEKIKIVSNNALAIHNLLTEIVHKYLECLDKYSLPVWSQIIRAVQKAFFISNTVGLAALRLQMVNFDPSLSAIIEHLSRDTSATLAPTGGTSLLFPHFFFNQEKNIVEMREMNQSDSFHMVHLINAIVATKASPKIEYKPVVRPSHPVFSASENRDYAVTSNLSQWDARLPIANIALIGNVNTGKSSLTGRILYDLGIVDPAAVERLAARAAELKAPGHTTDIKFAWVLDKTASEREKGLTIQPKYKGFQTPSRRFTIIDNPGHRDYVSLATGGIFTSDVVVLTVSALQSERSLAEIVRSQSEEHLVCAFCFGIKNIIVAINKMDAVGYSEESYQEAVAHTTKQIKKAGFKADAALFVPISAVVGEGLLCISPLMPWYSGPCLLQALDECTIPKRLVDKQLRIVIDEVLKVRGVGTVVCGKVDRGRVCVGDSLCVSPCGLSDLKVKSIESYHHSLPAASAGEEIGLALSESKSSSGGGGGKLRSLDSVLKKGMVLGLAKHPPPPVIIRFEAQIFITRNTTMRVGYSPTLMTNFSPVRVRVLKLTQIIDRNGATLEESPKEVTPNQICICEMEASKPFSAETIHSIPRLSRFLIREDRVIVAMGFIRSLTPS